MKEEKNVARISYTYGRLSKEDSCSGLSMLSVMVGISFHFPHQDPYIKGLVLRVTIPEGTGFFQEVEA